MKKSVFNLSIRCFYPGDTEPTRHYQDLKLSDIPKWIEAYKFTHPRCEAITFKIWLSDLDKEHNQLND